MFCGLPPEFAIVVKFDQPMITRPVSGSTSMNSLSAESRGVFVAFTWPFGFVAARIRRVRLAVWIRRGGDVEWSLPRVPAVGRAMEAHGLYGTAWHWRRRELLHHDRAVDEGAGSEVLDVGIAEHLWQSRRADEIVPR